jgi:predicted GNAT family acetyltransferase
MYSPRALPKTETTRGSHGASLTICEASAKATLLCDAEESEVLNFLSVRAIHTVALRGFIRDNGLTSPLNRGTFYGYRNQDDELEGVALIGHATLIEARTEAALAAFARAAQECRNIHMVMGEQELVKAFWYYYAQAGQALRLACREALLEKNWPVAVREPVPELRLATIADLDHIAPVQAEMALEESGVNPLEVDPVGFRARCARRIEQGRVWVWIEGERLIFKADIMSETPETIYLEGIYAHPEARGKGYSMQCLSQMEQTLLMRTKAICLLVNIDNHAAQAFYRKIGYKFRGSYDTIFLEKKEA